MDTTVSSTHFDVQQPQVQRMLGTFRSTWKMRLYFLYKLPTLWFWGVRIARVDHNQTAVQIPFSWRTQNPFRSIYFAAQAGAAELSTGMLAMIAIEGRGRISMLITGMEASYSKKATSRVTFHCNAGMAIRKTVQEALDTGEGQTITVETTGIQEDGTEVARMRFTWSFKVKF